MDCKNRNTTYSTLRHSLILLFILFSTYTSAYNNEVQERHDSILSAITGASSKGQKQIKITSFGAKSDGKFDCKKAFDKAMNASKKSKHGLHIIVPKGEWFIKGPIHIVSNTTIELQEGAVLKFSDNPDDYLPTVQTSWEGTFCQNYSPFIYGFCASNISIIGKGTIDGNCPNTFPTWRAKQKIDQKNIRRQNHENTPISERNYGKGHLLRPQLIQLFGCKNVTIENVFITNSPFWCIHLLKSENIICRNIRYDAKLVNNDGIDPEMSRNILIEGVQFNNGDDNIAIKAGRDNDGWGDNKDISAESIYNPQPTENVIIRNCMFKGLHGLVIGSEMSAGVRNVFVENCSYSGYNKRALYVKTNPNRGGFVHDIYFDNCKFGELEDLFYITSMYAGEGADDNHFTDIHDIHVSNVSAEKVRNAAIVLQGTEAKPLRNISFTNVNVGECRIGFSSTNAPNVTLTDCNLGGTVNSAPSQASSHDNLWHNK